MHLRSGRLVLLCAAALLAGSLLPGAQAKSLDGMREGALAWVEARSRDGAGSFAPHFAQAVESNGLATASWPPGNPLRDQVLVPGPEATPIQLLRPLHALALADDPRSSVEGELVQRVLASFDGQQFGNPTALNDDAYSILALTQAGLPPTDARLLASAQALAAAQRDDGGWGWAVDSPSGTDMTGLVLLALHLEGQDAGPLPAALAFVASTRSGDGYAETPGGTANCESTAWALRTQALGGDVDPAAWRFLLSLQQEDGGFAHLPGGPSDPLCTSEALTVAGLAHAGAVPFILDSGHGIPAPGVAWTVVALSAVGVAMSTRIRRG